MTRWRFGALIIECEIFSCYVSWIVSAFCKCNSLMQAMWGVPYILTSNHAYFVKGNGCRYCNGLASVLIWLEVQRIAFCVTVRLACILIRRPLETLPSIAAVATWQYSMWIPWLHWPFAQWYVMSFDEDDPVMHWITELRWKKGRCGGDFRRDNRPFSISHIPSPSPRSL